MAIGIQDQYFGTEIEMTGITRQRAAEKVAELFGTRAVCDGGYYGVWSVTDQEGKKWKFMYDGSIYTERRERGRMVPAGREYSTEMVSPKLSYGEMGKLQWLSVLIRSVLIPLLRNYPRTEICEVPGLLTSLFR